MLKIAQLITITSIGCFLVACGGSSSSKEETPNVAKNGICGTAHKTFSHEETSFNNLTFCSSEITPSVSLTFPNYGESISWSCDGVNGGSIAQCTAIRENIPEPINGECGTASRNFLFSEVEFSDLTFCSTDSQPNEIPVFPEGGGSTSWECNGEHNGVTAQCYATRNSEFTNTHLENNVELGPISGATVTILELEGQYSLYSTTTNNNAKYSIDTQKLLQNIDGFFTERPEYVLVTATGGYDLDPNDDGVREEGEAIALMGVVKGIIKLETLLTSDDLSINLISTAVAELLSDENYIDEEKIAYIAKQLGVKDINNDNKIDNQDVYYYRMAEHQSDAENILRERFLEAIHLNDRDSLIEIIKEFTNQLGLIFMSYEVTGDSAMINLNPANSDTTIRYSINGKQGDLLTHIYTEAIQLYENQYVVYQECTKENNCTGLQIASFNGKKVKPYFINTTDSPSLVDISTQNALRTDIKEKSIVLDTLVTEIKEKKIELEATSLLKKDIQEKLTLIKKQIDSGGL